MREGRGGRPKIAALLAQPDAAVVREVLTTARNAGVAPTLFLGMRMATQTYIYGDPDYPERVTSTISSPAFTPEDQALLMGLDLYLSTLCQSGFPRELAWHSEMDGFFEATEYVCHACSAVAGKQQTHTILKATRPPEKGPMPAFVLGKTTTSP